MKQINIIGNFLGITGYDRHTRGLISGLSEVHNNVRSEAVIDNNHVTYLTDNELKAVKRKFEPNSVGIMVSMPHTWPLGIAKKYDKFMGFCVWEGDKVPKSWINNFEDDRVDYILVPSNHTRDAIINTLKESKLKKSNQQKIFNKIKVIPHGYDPNKYYKKEVIKPKCFTFIANKGWSNGIRDRGGLQFLFKAFKEEFTGKDNVQLIAKLNPVYNKPNWNIKEEMSKLNLSGNAKMFTNLSVMSDEQLNNFYNNGDVFVNTSMAEAFCLPCIESMACGVPVITTEFGGQSDYVNNVNGWILKQGRMCNWSTEPMYSGTKWKKPNVKEIRKMLRYCYENQDKVKYKSVKALETSKQYTWKDTAKKLLELI